MLKLKDRNQTPESMAGTLPFEPLPDEPNDAYQMFTAFLASYPDHSPMQFIKDRDLNVDEWFDIASRYHWVSRRVDYWNYLAIRQRAKWIMALDECLVEFKSRLRVHYARIEQARDKEEKNKVLFAEFDRVVRTLDAEMAMAKDVVVALSGSARDSITIVNQQVGNVNLQKDVAAIAQAWDEQSKNVIEGTVKRREIGD